MNIQYKNKSESDLLANYVYTYKDFEQTEQRQVNINI